MLVTLAASLGAPPAATAVVTLTVAGSTSTQVVLSYAAPDATPCTIEASESPSLTPLVPDVNPTLFPGANRDDRMGSLVAGSARVVVLGRRAVERAADGNTYSRALQANTPHYVRVTCGTQVGTASVATTNIPNGFTRGEALPLDPANPGAYLWPTLSPTDRTQTFTDPFTGALLRRMSLPGDHPGLGIGHTSASFHTLCSNNLSQNGFYRCAVPVSAGEERLLYAIRPSDGVVRHLGALQFYGQTYGFATGVQRCESFGIASWMWDETNPNVYYCALQDSANRLVVAKVTYTGNDVAVSPGTSAALTPTNLTPGVSVTSLVAAFDPRFNPAKFGCGADAMQRGYLILACRRGPQDSYAWVAVFAVGNGAPIGSGGTGGIVAAVPMWQQAASRWCTLHTLEDSGHTPVATLQTQTPKGGGVGLGPYLVTLQTTMPVSSSRMTITVSSTCPVGFPGCVPGDPVSPQPDEWLMTAQPGDVFVHRGEFLRIASKPAATQWVVDRALFGSSATSHAIGDPLQMQCNVMAPTDYSLYSVIHWSFLSGPSGGAAQVYGVRTTAYGGHTMTRPGYWMMDAYLVASGNLTDGPPFWAKSPDMTVNASPMFAGRSAPAGGNTYPRHVGYGQVNAVGAEKNWFVDVLGFTGGNSFQNQANTSSVAIGGDLFKYFYNGQDSDGLSRRQLPTLAVGGSRPLRDLSGPGSRITGDSSSAYTYCVALVAGECVAGSTAGDIYLNVPNVDPSYRYCFGAETSLTGKVDFCVGDATMHGPGLPQFRIQAGVLNDPGVNARVLTRLFLPYRATPATANAKVLADGAHLLYAGASGNALLVKVPPQPVADGVDRTTFIPTLVAVPPPTVSGVATAVVAFGYAEEGPAASYRCSSRAETCIATASALDLANPFKYEVTEAYAGVPCVTGCTIAVPAIPQRVVYWVVRYRNASGAVVATGPQGVAIEGLVMSTSGGAAPPPPTADTTLPVVSIIAPAQAAAVSGVVTVNVSATDNVGVARIDYKIDGSLVASFSPPVTSFAWDSTAVAPGSHTLLASAWDAAGNVGQATVSFSTAALPAPGPVVGDSTTYPKPATAPGSSLAAGQSYVDPTFLTTIVKMSDPTTAPNGTRVNSWAGDSMFNASGTKLYLHHQGAGTFLYSVDPVTAQMTRLGQLPATTPSGLSLSYDGARWDPGNANVLYVMVTDSTRRELWQVSAPLPATMVLLHDFSTEVPAGGAASPRVQITPDSRYFTVAVSSAGSAYNYAVVWDRQAGTSRILNSPARIGTSLMSVALDNSGQYALLTTSDSSATFVWTWASDTISGAVTASAPDYFGGDIAPFSAQAVSAGAVASSLVSRGLAAPHSFTQILSYPRKNGKGDWFQDGDSSRGIANGSFHQSRFVDAFPWGTFSWDASAVYKMVGYRSLSADFDVPEVFRYKGATLQQVFGAPLGPGEWSYDAASDVLYVWLPDGSNPESNRGAISIFDWRPTMEEIVQVFQDNTGAWTWRRLAHHHMQWTGDPDSTPRGNVDLMGAFVLFQSNLDGSPRTDAFLLQVPPLPSSPSPADTTPPTVSFATPVASGTVVGTVNVTTSLSDNVGVVKVEYRLDGALVGIYSPPITSFAWNSTSVSDGPHSWTATAFDEAGNTSQAAVTFAVQNRDVTPPTVSVTSPTTGRTAPAMMTIAVSATDDRAMKQIVVYVDGVAIKTVSCAGTSCQTSFKWSTKALASGPHSVSAEATDAAGNRTASATTTFYCR